MDLESDYPSHLELRQYLGNFSAHRNLPVFTISKNGINAEMGRPLPRTQTSADHLAPGHYPVERDFPTTARRYEEIPSGWLTRSARVKHVFMPFEDRDKIWQRNLPGVKNPGPGHYYHHGLSYEQGLRSSEHTTPEWSIKASKETGGRPLPREKTAADHLGPGLYQLPNRFSEISWRTNKILDKAARTSRETWAGPQYSQVFQRIKPGEKGLSKASSFSTRS
ncbi:unnamed protein product [Durusdinium trenchii]|uniref:Uncharacterized protein n=2 Tax=Durusdinium trenchii TaxID=1381693 RepID=A0ABP0LTC1_9DINO